MGLLLVLIGFTLAPSQSHDTRQLAFYHTHTDKYLSVVYYHDGAYDRKGLSQIDDYLKDFRTGTSHAIDPSLLDVLFDIRVTTGSRAPFEVISAYRSPVTNEMLRHATVNTGVAKDSMHLRGQAIDVRLADVPLPKLRQVALHLKRGGVGFYPTSDFVHVDTGRVRYW
ncbi:MAG: DUF882 domain-containing protein [Proteobacteria bacterium]|nr:DUF882 domain-containing protein [Pseudomonadota bacterium]